MQLFNEIEANILSGVYGKGAHLPSMAEIASHTGMSKETVKRALVALRDRGYIASCPGKGYYVARDITATPQKLNILMILGSLDIFKQLLVDAFTGALIGRAEVKILLHNGNIDQLETYLEQYLDSYDYYVISPHFSIDDESQIRVAKILGRIPNRKLIMLDHCNSFMSGQFGAVFQDFKNDSIMGLREGLDRFSCCRRLNAVVHPSSRYGQWVLQGIEAFCKQYNITLQVLNAFPEEMEAGEVFILCTGQLVNELAEFDEILKKNGLTVGKNVGLISYNDVPLNAVVLGGLTTLSTDFVEMGTLAAKMILDGKMVKIHNKFGMTRRKTF